MPVKPLKPTATFPLASSNDLWDRVAQGDVKTLITLMDLGLHPLAKITGRAEKGNAERTSLWMLACEAPSGDALKAIWSRLNEQERVTALATKNGKNKPGMELAVSREASPIVEQLVALNATLPQNRQQNWNGWALLASMLSVRANARKHGGLFENTHDQRQKSRDLFDTLGKAGLLRNSEESPVHGKDTLPYQAMIHAILSGALGYVEALADRPLPWGSARYSDDIPWGWVLFSSQHPEQTLKLLLPRNIALDMTSEATPEKWNAYTRSFIFEPFRTHAQQGVLPQDLLAYDPKCRVVLEDFALRQVLSHQEPLTNVPRVRL